MENKRFFKDKEIKFNTFAKAGSLGAAGGTMNLTLTVGCNSYGGNISSENFTARHLINTKVEAYEIKNA